MGDNYWEKGEKIKNFLCDVGCFLVQAGLFLGLVGMVMWSLGAY